MDQDLKKQDIRCHIDTVYKSNNKWHIIGWAFGSKEDKLNVTVKGKHSFTVVSIKRSDVKTAYSGQLDYDECGFEIIINNFKGRKVTLLLQDKEKIKEEIINIKAYAAKVGIKKIKQLVYLITNIKPEYFRKAVICIRNSGFKGLWRKVAMILKGEFKIIGSYKEWLQLHLPDETELNSQRNTKFKYAPKISVIVPTYNTPIHFLKEMIESVINQTYSNWELCIADGSSKGKEVRAILTEYVKKDSRIKVKFLDTNKGIAGNTNECISLCTGEYIALFDHDDLLTPDALFEMVTQINKDQSVDFIYSDEDKVDETSKNYFDPHFKQDWAPDTFRSYNYICHFTVFKRSLLDQVGLFNSEFDGSQDYDMFLRLTEKAQKIVHIPKILYHWRVHKESTAASLSAKDYTVDAARRALQAHLNRQGIKGRVEPGLINGTHRINYEIQGNPKVSIIIPTKDHIDDLKKCLDAIKKSTYSNYEIIIVENNSELEETFAYYESLKEESNIQVVVWKDEFNYSRINNFGVKYSTGEYLILLNNDIEIVTPNWIEEMIMHCQREEVGIVGAKLYYPDDTIQHAGVIIGIGGVAGHSHKYFTRQDNGYFSRLKITQNLSAVTAACLMVRKDVFESVNGLDESFKVAFNDVDFCLRVRQKNKLIVFTPYVEAYHYESKSRGAEDTPEKLERFNGEVQRFYSRWGAYKYDPYYNPNLTLEKENFELKL